MKSKPFIRMAALCIMALAALGLFKFFSGSPYNYSINHTACVSYKGRECLLSLEIVDSVDERERGLSERTSMAPGTGMLFIFDQPGTQCMWMKGMNFSIDMLWLNEEGTVLKLEENVAPTTYPQDFCSENTKFVVEIAAGDAKNHGYKVGTVLSL